MRRSILLAITLLTAGLVHGQSGIFCTVTDDTPSLETRETVCRSTMFGRTTYTRDSIDHGNSSFEEITEEEYNGALDTHYELAKCKSLAYTTRPRPQACLDLDAKQKETDEAYHWMTDHNCIMGWWGKCRATVKDFNAGIKVRDAAKPACDAALATLAAQVNPEAQCFADLEKKWTAERDTLK